MLTAQTFPAGSSFSASEVVSASASHTLPSPQPNAKSTSSGYSGTAVDKTEVVVRHELSAPRHAGESLEEWNELSRMAKRRPPQSTMPCFSMNRNLTGRFLLLRSGLETGTLWTTVMRKRSQGISERRCRTSISRNYSSFKPPSLPRGLECVQALRLQSNI